MPAVANGAYATLTVHHAFTGVGAGAYYVSLVCNNGGTTVTADHASISALAAAA